MNPNQEPKDKNRDSETDPKIPNKPLPPGRLDEPQKYPNKEK